MSAWHEGAENLRFTDDDDDILEHDSLDPPPGSEIFLKQPSMESISSISRLFQHHFSNFDGNDIRTETILKIDFFILVNIFWNFTKK